MSEPTFPPEVPQVGQKILITIYLDYNEEHREESLVLSKVIVKKEGPDPQIGFRFTFCLACNPTLCQATYWPTGWLYKIKGVSSERVRFSVID